MESAAVASRAPRWHSLPSRHFCRESCARMGRRQPDRIDPDCSLTGHAGLQLHHGHAVPLQREFAYLHTRFHNQRVALS
jgi:hypothetical protein